MSAGWVSVGKAESIGSRKSQQDAADVVSLPAHGGSEERLLVVLGDGMGGHSAGDVASTAAVNAFMRETQQCSAAPASEVLERGLQAASEAVKAAAAADPASADMGTTLVAGVIERDGDATLVRWVSVGDSPLWRVSAKGQIERLNVDQSLAGELEADVKAGRVSAKEAETDPRRNQSNVLTLALSATLFDSARADRRLDPLRLEAGDMLVFASDGVESLPEKKIAEAILRKRSAGAPVAAKALVKTVLGRRVKRQDNIMVVLVDPYERRKRGLFG